MNEQLPVTALAGPQPGFEIQDEAAEAEQRAVEAGDIKALYDKETELHGIHEVERGLEDTIVGAGLQVMADRYGAERLLGALRNGDPKPTTMAEVVAKLAPNQFERKSLFAAIKKDSMAELGDRFNSELGGLTTGEESDDTLDRSRKYELMAIQNGKPTDAGNLLLTGNFDALLRDHPELVDGFRESNDTLALLKGIRAIYETEHSQFTSDLERAKASIEELVAKGEAEFVELGALSNEVLSDEIAKLQEKLAGRTGDAGYLLKSMLDQRTAEMESAQAQFDQMAAAVRSQVVGELGADRVSHLGIPDPARPQPMYHPTKQPLAQAA